MMISVVIALMVTRFGLFISFYELYPVSFFIASAVFLLYILTRVLQWATKFKLT